MRIPQRTRAYLASVEMTDAQWNYMKALINQSFANRYELPYTISVHHRPDRMLKDEASDFIAQLVAARNRGWK